MSSPPTVLPAVKEDQPLVIPSMCAPFVSAPPKGLSLFQENRLKINMLESLKVFVCGGQWGVEACLSY